MSILHRNLFTQFAVFGSAVAGMLDIFNGFQFLSAGSTANEWVYVITDISILLALVGWLGALHSQLGWFGKTGWLASFCGFGFIAGPSAQIGDVDAYVVGTGIIGVGLTMLALESFRRDTLPRHSACLLLLAVVLGVMGGRWQLASYPLVLSNIVLGVAFLSLSLYFARAVRSPLTQIDQGVGSMR